MNKDDMIADLLRSKRQSGESEDLGATITSASLRLEQIIDRIIANRESNG